MSNLQSYINEVKEKTKGLNEIETIRYIYLDLGKKFSFDKRFYSGNSSQKKISYTESGLPDAPEKGMASGIIICKTSSRILKEILNSLDIYTDTYTVYDDADKQHPHVYNICRLKDGRVISLDLQQDLNNIQSHSRTKFFGLNGSQTDEVLSRFEIEQIDKKLGYITPEKYYSDSYIDMLKYHADMFDDFYEKADFVLQNLEIFENKYMEFPERNWYHKRLLEKVFPSDEYRKLIFMKCYTKDASGQKEYKNYIGIERGAEPIFYRYNEDEAKYDRITPEELIQDEENGLVVDTGIYGLKQIRKRYLESHSRDDSQDI